jgi:hypothetical protein
MLYPEEETIHHVLSEILLNTTVGRYNHEEIGYASDAPVLMLLQSSLFKQN